MSVTFVRKVPLESELIYNIAFTSGEHMAARSVSPEERSATAQTGSDRSGQNSPDALITVMTEMFISEENLNRMENILDTWSTNLKVCFAIVCFVPFCCIPQYIIGTVSWSVCRVM